MRGYLKEIPYDQEQRPAQEHPTLTVMVTVIVSVIIILIIIISISIVISIASVIQLITNSSEVPLLHRPTLPSATPDVSRQALEREPWPRNPAPRTALGVALQAGRAAGPDHIIVKLVIIILIINY